MLSGDAFRFEGFPGERNPGHSYIHRVRTPQDRDHYGRGIYLEATYSPWFRRLKAIEILPTQISVMSD